MKGTTTNQETAKIVTVEISLDYTGCCVHCAHLHTYDNNINKLER